MVFWEQGNQITDIVIELSLKDLLSDGDAVFERSTLLDIDQVLDLLQLILHT